MSLWNAGTAGDRGATGKPARSRLARTPLRKRDGPLRIAVGHGGGIGDQRVAVGLVVQTPGLRDLLVKDPVLTFRIEAEGDVVGPVRAARHFVLHREVAVLDDEAVGAVVEGIALAAVVGAHDHEVVACRQPVMAIGLLHEDQQRTRRRLLARVARAVHGDEIIGARRIGELSGRIGDDHVALGQLARDLVGQRRRGAPGRLLRPGGGVRQTGRNQQRQNGNAFQRAASRCVKPCRVTPDHAETAVTRRDSGTEHHR
ncbi:hypothetical protein PT2222_70017 [Paraburkholderia tropica]